MTLDFGGLSKVGGGKPSADLDFGGLTRADGGVAESSAPVSSTPSTASSADGGGFFSELGSAFKRTIMRDNPQSMADALEMGSVLVREDGPAAAGAKIGEMVRPKGQPAAPMRETRDPLGDYSKSIKGWIKKGDDGGQAAVPEIRNIRGLGDAVKWFGNALGSAAGSSAPSIGTGLAAAAVTKNPVAGFFAGAFGPSYVQNSGDTYATLRDDPGVQAAIKAGKITDKEIAGWAAVASVPIAALDAYGAEKMLPLKKLKGELMSRMIKRLTIGGLAEGGTEGFQQILQEATLAAVGGSHDLATAAYNVFENFAQGTVGGTALGAASEPFQSAEAPAPPPPDQAKDDILPGVAPEEELDVGTAPIDQRMAQPQASPPDAAVPPPPSGATEVPRAPVASAGGPAPVGSDEDLLRETLGDDVEEITKPGGEHLNEGDLRSPLPTADIREGKKLIDDLIGAPATEKPAIKHVDEMPDIPPETLDDAAHMAATSPLNDLDEPTQAQKEAGTYRKGHKRVGGIDLAIENPEGSKRTGVAKDGTEWTQEIKDAHYGYAKGTVGKDKDHLDVFVKPGTDTELADTAPAFIIDQKNEKGDFDEHKIMVGYANRQEALAAYHANYAPGWKGMGAITATTQGGLKAWMKDGNTKQPLAYKGGPAAQQALKEKIEAKRASDFAAMPSFLRNMTEAGRASYATVSQDRREVAEALGHKIDEIRKAGGTGRAAKLQEKLDDIMDSIMPVAPEKGGKAAVTPAPRKAPRSKPVDVKTAKAAIKILDEGFEWDAAVAEAKHRAEGGKPNKAPPKAGMDETKAAEIEKGLPAGWKIERKGGTATLRDPQGKGITQTDETDLADIRMHVQRAKQEQRDRDEKVERGPMFQARSIREGKETANPKAEKTEPKAEAKPKEKPAPAEPKASLRKKITDTPAFRKWFADSKVVDAKGEPQVVYHGAARSDRINPTFDKRRATSGPMAFFTDDPEIASSYSTKKPDTSLDDEEHIAQRFTIKAPGMRKGRRMDQAWWSLPNEERQRIASLASRVYQNDDGDIVLDDQPRKDGIGNYDYEIKEQRGDHLKALAESWLHSGQIFGEEERFLEVLKLAGLTSPVEYADPNFTAEGVFPVFLSIQNPLDTSAIPDTVATALDKASRRQRNPQYDAGKDQWDKTIQKPQDWMQRLRDDAKSGSTHAWTSIPDWVTKTLASLGYDGIKDTGGKGGGQGHNVWIPFEEEQVKSVNNRGTFDPSNRNMMAKLRTEDSDAAFRERAQEVGTRLRDEMNRLGLDDVGLRISETLSMMVDGKNLGADGVFVEGLIKVALDAANYDKTLHHEAIHALKALKVFTPTEWAILERMSNKRWRAEHEIGKHYREMSDAVQTEEGIAEAFVRWKHGRGQTDGIIAKIFRKIDAVLRAIERAFSKDARLAEQLFRKIDSGEIGRRERNGSGQRQDPMFQAAWHGTPHDFDQFSLDHMGKGEGAQAFGWGLYFAGKKEIAEYYRDKLSSRRQLTLGGKEIMPRDLSAEQLTSIIDKITSDVDAVLDERERKFWKQGDSYDKALVRSVIGTIEANIDGSPHATLASAMTRAFETYFAKETGATNKLDEMENHVKGAMVTAMQRNDVLGLKAPGKLFKVDLPEDSELMDYDAPLGEQSKAIQKAAEKAMAGEEGRPIDVRQLTGQRFYGQLSLELGGDQAASEALRAAGIPGHRFLDNTSRQNSSNYVIKEVKVDGETRYQPTDTKTGNTQAAFATRELAQEWIDKNKPTFNYVIYDDSRIAVEAKFRLRGLSGGIPPINIASKTQWLVDTIKGYRNESTETPERALDYSARKWTDYLRPLLTLMRQAGASLPEQMNAYSIARRALDMAAVRVRKMEAQYVQPMMQALAEGGATLEDLHQFASAKHVPERNRVVGLRNEEGSQFHNAVTDPTVVGASGWSKDEAKKVLDDFRKGDPKKFAALQEAHRLLRALLDDSLAGQLRDGLISQAQYDQLKAQWKNYVPMMSEEAQNDSGNLASPGTGKGFDVRGKEFKGATGRYTKAENVPAYAVALAERGHLRAEKNAIGKSLLRFVNMMIGRGEKGIAEVYWTEDSDIQDPGMADIEKAQTVYKRELGKDGKVKKVKVPTSTISPDMFATKVGGRQIYIKFADEKIGMALKNMSSVQLGLLLQLSRKVTNWQSLVNTRLNPAFIPLNFMRDIGTAFVHLLDDKAANFTVAEAGKTVMKITKAIPAVWRKARGKTAKNQYDKYLEEWENIGGRLIYDKARNIEDTVAELRTKLMAVGNDRSKLKKVWPAFRNFFGDLNDTIESGIRLSTYVELRKKGWTPEKAALESRDLTVDFRQHGEMGPKGNALFAFFNASIIGNINVAGRLVRSKRVRRAAYAAVAMGVAIDLLNRAMSGDADDGEDEYEKLLRTQPWIFERNMVIFYNAHDFIKVPMPFGYNGFYHMGLMGTAAAHGNVSPLDAAGNSIRVMADAFNPMGGVGNFWGMIMPTALDPFDEIRTNTNFSNNPIYPKRMPGETTPDSQKSFRSTPWVYKKIAEGANWITGGNEVEPGYVDVHPDSIQHVVDFTIGGLGRFVQDIVNPGLNLFAGEDPHFEKLPYVKQLTGEADNPDAKRSEFYDLREQVETVESYQKKHKQRGEAGKADLERLQKENPVEIDSIPAFNTASRQLSKISKRRRNLEGQTDISAEERKRRAADIDKDEIDAMNRARMAYAKNRKKDADQ